MYLKVQIIKENWKKKCKERLQGIDQQPIDDPLISITESQRLNLHCSWFATLFVLTNYYLFFVSQFNGHTLGVKDDYCEVRRGLGEADRPVLRFSPTSDIRQETQVSASYHQDIVLLTPSVTKLCDTFTRWLCSENVQDSKFFFFHSVLLVWCLFLYLHSVPISIIFRVLLLYFPSVCHSFFILSFLSSASFVVPFLNRTGRQIFFFFHTLTELVIE
jgi:hypothetical protein